MKISKIFLGSLFLVYFLVTALIWTLLAFLLLPFLGRESFHRISKFWFKNVVIPVSGIKVEVSGLGNIPKEAVIFASNHQSAADIGILLDYIPGSFKFIVKKEYFKVPIFGWYTALAGHLPVDREEGSEANKTLERAKAILKQGKSIMIFPEGTRSRDGKLGPFKRGSLKLAFETGRPIVPIAISGSYKILRSGSLLINAGTVTMKIGEPMNFAVKDKISKQDYQEALDKVRNTIAAML